MPIKSRYNQGLGFINEEGRGVEIQGNTVITNGLDVTRNVTFNTSPDAGTNETSGSVLQLKGRAEGIHFHMGGNQYVSNNSWFDADHSESVFGRWIYDTTSGGAFRWGFRASAGAFDLDWAKSGVEGQVITGSNSAIWGTGLSMSASNGAIGLGKKANSGLSATFDITGSNAIALSVTGSVDVGGGAPDSYFILPRLTTTQRNALNAVNGMMIYNTTLNKFQGYENGSWVSLI